MDPRCESSKVGVLKQRRTGPEIEVAQDELAAIVDPYGLRVADFAADSFQRLDHVFAAILEGLHRSNPLFATGYH